MSIAPSPSLRGGGTWGAQMPKRVDYEEFKILGCAVEGYSSSHHCGSHRTDDHVMYGQWPILSLPPTPSAYPQPLPKRRGEGRGANKKPSSYI